MLTVKEAKKIGISACINHIGIDFCKKHSDNAVSSWGENNGKLNCFVGVSDEPDDPSKYDINKITSLVLTHGNDWPFYAFSTVDMNTGETQIGDSKVPRL